MNLFSYVTNHIKKYFKQVKSLKYIIIIPFVIQIFIFTSVITFLSFHNAQQSVNYLANQLLSEIGTRVENKFQKYISQINLILQINAKGIELGQLNPNDSFSLTQYFWKQLLKLPDISYIYWGDRLGNFYGVYRLADNTLGYSISYKSKNEKNYFFRVLEDGSRGDYLQKPKEFDPRVRLWYKSAVANKAQIWTPIYTEYTTKKRTISSAYPIFKNDNIQGVIGVDIIFDQLYDFFSRLKVGKNGEVLVINDSGEIVMSSKEGQKFVKYIENKENQKSNFKISNNNDPLIVALNKYIKNQFKEIKNITASKQFFLKVNNQAQYIYLTPISDNNGLNWIIIVAVPESDFMAQIIANTRNTILLCCLGLVISICIGMLTAEWIVRPIYKINKAAKLLANGYLLYKIKEDRADELGQLAKSFNNMAERLQKSIAEIKESEERLTRFLQAMPIGVFVIDSEGRPYYANKASDRILSKELNRDICPTKLISYYQLYEADTKELYPNRKNPLLIALKKRESVMIEDMEVYFGNKRTPLQVFSSPIVDKHDNVEYAIVAFFDITDRKIAKEKLESAKQELEEFLEAVPIGVLIADRFGNPYRSNSAAKKILGDRLSKIKTASELAQYYPTFDQFGSLYQKDNYPIARALRGDNLAALDVEIEINKGKRIPIEINATPVRNEKGELIYAIAAFQDISERERLKRENLLLQPVEMKEGYQLGGGLKAGASTYVVRPSDRQLYQKILKGDFCYVFNARQMGKSSLRNKTMRQLEGKGYRCAAIDLTEIGSVGLTLDEWYGDLVFRLSTCLQISKFNSYSELPDWWASLNGLSSFCKIQQFIYEIVLKNIKTKIVIFIDEIDSVRRLSFNTDDFFCLIRILYDSRERNPELERLNFVLLGAATPRSLMSDLSSSIFNVGVEITLSGFKIDETQPLAKGIKEKCDRPLTVLEEILRWTGGQPFLTQKICHFVKESPNNISAGFESQRIEQLVRDKIILDWTTKDNPAHLDVIQQVILKSPNKSNLLKIYQKILEGAEVKWDNSDLHKELILSGLIITEKGFLKVFNSIYTTIFDSKWSEQNQ